MNGDNIFRQKYTRIEGLSTIRRLPRLGKIRLGIKVEYGAVKTNKEGIREPLFRPKEVDYFVCPPEIKKFYGDEPKELNIMFPLNDPEVLFPQAYKYYGSGKGLKCRGDGINATRLNEETNEMEERSCPCELLGGGKCKQVASLSFMMPSIKIGGVYQIDLSSYHSIVDINSGFDYAMAMLGGRIAMVPFILRRVPRETHNEGKKQTHYTLTMELDIPLEYAQRIREGENIYINQKRRYEIEPPKEYGNPACDSKEDGAVIVVEETEEDKKAKQAELQEKAEKENKQLRENEAKLKKEIEEGKHNIRTPAQIKETLEKREAIIAGIVEVAKKNNVTTWREIANIGERHNIFARGLVASQVKTYVVNHPEKCEALKEAIRCDQEVTDEDLPSDEEPGSSYDNALPFKGKKKALKKIGKVEDFISPEENPLA